MADFYFNTNVPEDFLQYWSDHPILCGGDRYSSYPGFTIHYLQHTESRTFEIHVLPVLPNCTDALKAFLRNAVGLQEGSRCITVTVNDDEVLIAKVLFKVDYQSRYVLGEGEWYEVQGHPSRWNIAYELH